MLLHLVKGEQTLQSEKLDDVEVDVEAGQRSPTDLVFAKHVIRFLQTARPLTIQHLNHIEHIYLT